MMRSLRCTKKKKNELKQNKKTYNKMRKQINQTNQG